MEPFNWRIIRSVGNDLNQTVYRSRFKSLRVTCDFDTNRSTGGDLRYRFKSILNDFDFSLTLTVINHLQHMLGNKGEKAGSVSPSLLL